MISEIWKPLIHPEIQNGYMLSSYGRIKVNNIEPYNPSYKSSNGYDYESFIIKDEYRIKSSIKMYPIDDLVALTFISIPYNLQGKRIRVNHIDGNTLNNNLKNLEWVSIKNNVRHSFDTGLEVNPCGEAHPRSKFSDIQRDCIYEIIKSLPNVPPSLLSKLISDKLPNITTDDIKYAKKLIKLKYDIVFPKIPFNRGNKISRDEMNKIKYIINNIFYSYNINQTEVYVNEYKK